MIYNQSQKLGISGGLLRKFEEIFSDNFSKKNCFFIFRDKEDDLALSKRQRSLMEELVERKLKKEECLIILIFIFPCKFFFYKFSAGVSEKDEEAIEKEKRLIAGLKNQTNTLVSIKDASAGIRYTEPMPSTYVFFYFFIYNYCCFF